MEIDFPLRMGIRIGPVIAKSESVTGELLKL